jgi:hypothetical protein
MSGRIFTHPTSLNLSKGSSAFPFFKEEGQGFDKLSQAGERYD